MNGTFSEFSTSFSLLIFMNDERVGRRKEENGKIRLIYNPTELDVKKMQPCKWSKSRSWKLSDLSHLYWLHEIAQFWSNNCNKNVKIWFNICAISIFCTQLDSRYGTQLLFVDFDLNWHGSCQTYSILESNWVQILNLSRSLHKIHKSQQTARYAYFFC